MSDNIAPPIPGDEFLIDDHPLQPRLRIRTVWERIKTRPPGHYDINDDAVPSQRWAIRSLDEPVRGVRFFGYQKLNPRPFVAPPFPPLHRSS